MGWLPRSNINERNSKTVFYLPCLCIQKEQCGLFASFSGTHSGCSVHWASQWRLLWVLWLWELWKELCSKWACVSHLQVTPKTRQWLCWKFIFMSAVQMLSSVLAAFVGILGSGYCITISALALSQGPYCFTHLERNWIYPFTDSSGG